MWTGWRQQVLVYTKYAFLKKNNFFSWKISVLQLLSWNFHSKTFAHKKLFKPFGESVSQVFELDWQDTLKQ